MPLPKSRGGFLRRMTDNLERIDKQTLLDKLLAASAGTEAWQKLVVALDEGVIVVTPDGLIDFANPAAESMLGAFDSANSPVWKQIADDDVARFLKTHLKNLSSGTAQTFKILDPTERTVKLKLIPNIFSDSAKHLIAIQDLTNPLLPEVERLARARLDALIRLAGGLAHEIGNPLNAMALHSEILKKQIQKLRGAGEANSLNETLQVIRDEITRLDRIVRNFLKSTRRAPLRFQILDFCSILKDVLRVMRPSLEEHNIKLELDIPKQARFFIDEERMRSLFINLIQNALEAMPEGGKLKICCQAEGRVLRCEISDSGRGISEDDLPHIFEAYFTTKSHGSGLGLLFVHDTVTDHGGKVHVKSIPGKGTTFEILLPLRRHNLQISNHNQTSSEVPHA